ncbi:hypothetical protein GRX03_07055 [Halovenus sp. WSH3]|uniref:SWIM-type domain-containing protein n=1 Tax=Halovenus carboxidivorans TaxID=2692199 RepID=A0A6B0T918_9EURY|nr:SWIM zinc finger family protein [Halovenus carboxidivorans]MXR51360.1 hypothetical protein [Halovenus carboxidivorans]
MSSETTEQDIGPEPRTLRALTEPMSVLPEMGRAKGAEDLYLVVSSSGKEYLVDARDWSCDCPDATHRDVRCKHQRAVAIRTGRLDPDELEEELATTARDLETSAERLHEKAHDLESSAEELRDAMDRLQEVAQ